MLTNKLKFFKATLVVSTVVAITGCSTDGPQINPKLTYYGKDDLKSGRIKLPANTSTDNFRKILMAVDFKGRGDKAGTISKETVQTVATRLQDDFASLKRFTVFSIHNRGGVRTLQTLGDMDEANMSNLENRTLAAVDYVLSGAVTVSRSKETGVGKNKFFYEVECDFNCEELKTKTVAFALKAKGRAYLDGNWTSVNEESAINRACQKAVAVAANKLGNEFPIGGRVRLVMASGRFAFDKGAEHGIGGDSQVVLFADYGGGLKIPLAVALSDGVEKFNTTAVVHRWNDDDVDAEPIIEDIKRGKSSNYKLYAVQYGMPIPPEWENAYKGN